MRKRRILSLLLAVAVMATMLVAVPLTASADYSDTDNLITWDFAEYTQQQDLQPTVSGDAAVTLDYKGLKLYGNNKAPDSGKSVSDYVSAKDGFHCNGTSSSTIRYIEYTPKFNGTLTVEYKSNNKSATDRWTAIGTSVVINTTIPEPADPAIIASGYTDGNNLKTISGELEASTKYFIYFGEGGQSITKLTYKYTPAETESKGWINNSSDKENSTVTEVGGEATLTYKANYTGNGFSYDLTDEISGMPPESNPSTVDGFIEVSCEVTMPENMNGNTFVDLSGSKEIPGWNPNNNSPYQYARFGANRSWSTIRYCGGQNATTRQGYDGANKVADGSTFVPVKFKIDMTDKKNVIMSYNNDEQVIAGFASTIGEKLYLNIQPTDTANAEGEVSVKVKNISAKYIARSEVTFGEGESDAGYYTSDDTVNGTKYGVIRFLQPLEGEITEYGFYFLDENGNIVKTEKHVSGSGQLSDGSAGIYADLSEIPETFTPSGENAQEIKPWTVEYNAKAYVVSGGNVYFGEAISGRVGDSPEWVVNPTNQ